MTKANKQADEIAALKRKVAALEAKAAQAPAAFDAEAARKSADEWRDMMRRAEDARFRNFPHSPELMRGYAAACPDHVMHEIALRDSRAPQGPCGQGVTPSTGQPAGVMPGDGKGWKPQRDFGSDGQHPTPGVAAADRIADAFARRDRAELVERLAERPK